MIRINTGKSGTTAGTSDTQMVLNLEDKLNLPVDAAPISTIDATTVAPEADYGPSQEQLQMPDDTMVQPTPLTPEANAQLQEVQDEMEAVQTLQDRFNMAPENFGLEDLTKVFRGGAGRIQAGLDSLQDNVDQLVIPFGETRKQVVMDTLGFPQKPKELAEGEVDTDLYINPDKSKKLTQAGVLGHLGAVKYSKDSRGFRATRDWNTLNMAMVEGMLSKSITENSLIPEGLVESIGKEDASKMIGVPETELESAISDGQLGKTIVEEWVKLRQRAVEGPDAEINAHRDPKNQLTKEAYEMIGLMSKQSYALAHPSILQVHSNVKTKSGGTRTDYLPTAHGIKLIKETAQDLLPPTVKARPQRPEGNQYSPDQRKTTGTHVVSKADRNRMTSEEEASINLASVRHVISAIRLKAGMFLALVGIASSADVKQDPETGMLTVDGQAAEMLGVGQDMADTINNASRNAQFRIQVIQAELEGMRDRYSDYAMQLEENMDGLIIAAAAMSQPKWKMDMYKMQATKALGMIQDIAEFKDDPISFTHYIQQGTSRIGVAQFVMNMQNNKFARQMYGSGTVYTIVPGGKSNAEKAMLITMGAHLFADGNNIPMVNYNLMRDRINSRDDKIMQIAAVGRKLAVMLDSVDTEGTAGALLKMDIVENRVEGVQAVLDTRKELNQDPDVKAFLNEVMKHPDEAIHLIEEAVELGKYMDSVESGKPFTSTMRPLEVDGISNGLAGMGAQLGMISLMHQVGVLRTDPDKILAELDGVSQNIRKELAKNMSSSLEMMLADSGIQKQFKVSTKDYDAVKTILDLAIKNEKEFLKPPLMTMPYGQAIKSMIGSMLRTVTTSPQLLELAESHKLKVAGVAKLLHVILEHNLETTLGSAVKEFSEAVKDISYVAMAANEPILIVKPTGTLSSFNTTSSVDTGGTVKSKMLERAQTPVEIKGKLSEFSDPSKKNPSVLSNDKGEANVASVNSSYPATKRKIDALGTKSTGAPALRQNMLAQSIIMLDGATVTLTLSGKKWKMVQMQSGAKTPYVSAIYDAIIGDLGSMFPLMDAINQTWKETVIEYDLLQNIADGAEKAQVKGKKKLQLLADREPHQRVTDTDQASNLLDMAYAEIFNFRERDDSGHGDLQVMMDVTRDIDDRVTYLAKKGGMSKRESMQNTPNRAMTNKQALALFKAFEPIFDRKIKRMRKAAYAARARRIELGKTIGNNPVYQYAVDAIDKKGKEFKWPY